MCPTSQCTHVLRYYYIEVSVHALIEVLFCRQWDKSSLSCWSCQHFFLLTFLYWIIDSEIVQAIQVRFYFCFYSSFLSEINTYDVRIAGCLGGARGIKPYESLPTQNAAIKSQLFYTWCMKFFQQILGKELPLLTVSCRYSLQGDLVQHF